MKFKIGFTAEEKKENLSQNVQTEQKPEITPKPSLVTISFPNIHKNYSYYNDHFDLREGDTVFVSGKLENIPGKVVKVSYSFKIKLSDYQRVISVADTDIRGQLCFSENKIISFDPNVMPYDKIASWYFPPSDPAEIVCGEDDDTVILLDDISTWKAPRELIEYVTNFGDGTDVEYLSLDNGVGRAIFKDSKQPYTVEFWYKNGEISRLNCGCYCVGMCEHEVAVLFELRRRMKWIEENYADQFSKTSCFAELDKAKFCNTVLMSRKSGMIQIG